MAVADTAYARVAGVLISLAAVLVIVQHLLPVLQGLVSFCGGITDAAAAETSGDGTWVQGWENGGSQHRIHRCTGVGCIPERKQRPQALQGWVNAYVAQLSC